MRNARHQVQEVAFAQGMRLRAGLEKHLALQAQQRDLTRCVVLVLLFTGGQHHADHFQLIGLDEGAGGGVVQARPQGPEADDFAGLGVGQCHGGHGRAAQTVRLRASGGFFAKYRTMPRISASANCS